MKKILAVVCIFAALFSFASCKRRLTPEEEEASRAVARSKAVAEYESKVAASIKHEEEIVENKVKTLEELGKTEKGKQIVYKGAEIQASVKYYALFMDNNGYCDYELCYHYYADEDAYKLILEREKKDESINIADYDESKRLIVYRREYDNKSMTYDDALETIRKLNYTIVE